MGPRGVPSGAGDWGGVRLHPRPVPSLAPAGLELLCPAGPGPCFPGLPQLGAAPSHDGAPSASGGWTIPAPLSWQPPGAPSACPWLAPILTCSWCCRSTASPAQGLLTLSPPQQPAWEASFIAELCRAAPAAVPRPRPPLALLQLGADVPAVPLSPTPGNSLTPAGLFLPPPLTEAVPLQLSRINRH